MTALNEEKINQVWSSVAVLLDSESDSEITALIGKFEQLQPNVLAYLFAAGGELLDEDEHAAQFFYGTIVWQVLPEVSAVITEDELAEREEYNFRTYESLVREGDESPANLAPLLVESCSQPLLLQHIADDLLTDPPPANNRERNEAAAWMLIHLRAVIDCLDKAM